jgi:hypothetical protein
LAAWASHAKHDDPAPPQFIVERTSHVVPLQQPAGHDVASQMQLPPAQRCPPPHCAPLPQVQAPFVASQPSALEGSHATHTDPWAPQVAVVAGVTHVVPSQHPLHDPQLEHVPWKHCCP